MHASLLQTGEPSSVFDRLESVSKFLKLLDDSVFPLTPSVSCDGASIAVMLHKHLTPALLDDALGALDKVLPQPEAKRVSFVLDVFLIIEIKLRLQTYLIL